MFTKIFYNTIRKNSFHRSKITIFLYILIFFGLTWIIYRYFFPYIYIDLQKDGKNLKEIADKWLGNSNNKEIELPQQLQPYTFDEKLQLKNQISSPFETLNEFSRSVKCPILFNSKHPRYNETIEMAAEWNSIESENKFWKSFEKSSDICKTLKDKFTFFSKPLSSEESEFPIAYGMLVSKDIQQMTYQISAFYHPQNAYCIAVDGKASTKFKERIKVFQKCFPNIHVYITREIHYCGPQISVAVLSCLQKLTERKHSWKYFQYLSNSDLPLKTNLEMVRIFKALNGTFNAEVTHLSAYRIPDKKIVELNLPLWKSSLSATFSRESANSIVRNELVFKLLLNLGYSICSDETLWATIAGNPDQIPLPGGFSALKFYKKINEDFGNHEQIKSPFFRRSTKMSQQRFPLQSYYISRYQVWEGDIKNDGGKLKTTGICDGKYVKQSCVFGVGDLVQLINRPELVAHKLYLDFEPAAFFCLYQNIRERALNEENQNNFDASYYSNLPQVQLSKGKSYENVQMFF